jgi:uncharacterized protein (DUF1800 family)
MRNLIKRLDVDPAAAWSPYRPSAEQPWNLRRAGHLYRRVAFGGNWNELQQAVQAGPDATLQRLLQGAAPTAELDAQCASMAKTMIATGDVEQMKALWLFRMLNTPHPAQEKLTLFWHNHFATSNAKVNNVGYMLGQNELLRRHALGNFGTLLQEISKDPAMLVWLDTVQSKRGMPNENYARELMELFSLGIGNYTEADIRQAARAFTGWEIRGERFFFNRSQHDAGTKTVLGQTGNWGGEDVVRICLEQSACPRFIVRKLFRFYVSETLEPSDELIAPVAEAFRKSNYEIRVPLEMMLRSQLFYSPEVYRTQVKAPTDFAIGIVRGLEGRVGTLSLADALDNLGQRLFYPPSVKGWDGGTAWLNSTTLLHRQNLALALTSTQDARFGRRTDPAALARKHGKKSDEEVVGFFVDLFLQGDLSDEARQGLLNYLRQASQGPYPVYWSEQDREDHRLRAVCHLVLTLPEFQLN